MDPITSGLTILQLIQTIAQASALLYGYVASVCNADSSCQGLLNELSAVGGVLTTVMAIERGDSLPPNLSHALSTLMATDGPVVKLLVELKSILPNEQAGKMKTISRLTWPFKEKEAGAIIDRLKNYCGEIAKILAIDTWNTLKEVKHEIQQVNWTLQEHSAAQKVREQAKERRKLLEWMNPVSCEEKHATSRGQRNLGTGCWIFQNDQFVAWNNSYRAFLWLNGQAGHGKTILTSAVVDEIQGSNQAEPQTLAFFYCNFRDDRTTNAAAVLRSLVVQLLQQSKDDWITKIGVQQESNTERDLDSLRKLWKQQRDGKPHPTDLGFLLKLLVEASTLVCRPVFVIDALDECRDYPDLVRHLANLTEDARLRLFVTSRSEPDIQDAFYGLPTMLLKDSAEQMKADICAHITEQLNTQKKLSRLPHELKKIILEKLLEKAEGMFRWVQCQLDEIVACKRRIDIEAALDNLPAGLYETYDRIIQAIKRRGRSDYQIARSCLLWLAGTFTPLTLDQLNEAMMIKVGQSNLNPDLGVMDPMDIVAACGSLVTYNEKTQVVTLSHYSVKEYLISRPNNIFKSISDMHAQICELLITYVLCDFVDEICAKCEHLAIQPYFGRYGADVAEVGEDHPLLSYAVLGWKHLEHVSDENPDIMEAISRLYSGFLQNTENHRVLAKHGYFYFLIPTNRWLSAAVTSPSLLFIPLEHGKPWMVESLVKQHPYLLDVDVASGLGSPLIFAIAKRPDCLSIFLKPGDHLNKPSSIRTHSYHGIWIEGGSYAPISWAAATGNKFAVNLLLLQTEVNLPGDILHMALRWRKPLHEFIRECRRRGADANFTVDGDTPLHYLLRYAQIQPLHVVKALVEPSCNLSLQNWTARTVLHNALDDHLEDVVAYLLEENAGLSATATLLPDMWSWATNKMWFPKVQEAALAADQPCTRIKGKPDVTAKSANVKFLVAATASRYNPNPICAIVVSAILNSAFEELDS
ncbi:uncharacterized protein HD556DRAFT_517086 [Suillus plorans]|uniref:NACHT domain-containing protein n=1 Tax=Suillus plorans TaxID=116603 RepID=A0A9P7ANS7_9AGAM|nr:uncharacterized protein HD556DRAFT_517086 [Suillus plorans]KAG1793063.1 hypothetical protein HD556DRAFT_517086 [Suillus plorans]